MFRERKVLRNEPAACGAAALLLWALCTGTTTPREPDARHATLARQAALDRAGFSPGLLDGLAGRKTEIALHAFQKSRGLPVTGKFDNATLARLGVPPAAATAAYKITAADLREVGPVPPDWVAKSKQNRLRYESLTALLAERGHCTRATVQWLNRGKRLDQLRPGDTVVLPNVWHPAPPRAAVVLVDRARRLSGRLMRRAGQSRCFIARSRARRRSGRAAPRA